MKNRTAKTTTVRPNAKDSNKKIIVGSPRPKQEMEVIDNNRSRFTFTTTMGPNMQNMQQEIEMNRMNAIPFKNAAINILDRQRYGISREFDGQEMDGMLMERPTVGGGRVEVESFDMPGGGSSMSRTRYNNQGQPVRRVTKDKQINK